MAARVIGIDATRFFKFSLKLCRQGFPPSSAGASFEYSSTQTLARFIRQEFGATPIELREELQRE